jgi:hypothetical protein
LSGEARVEKIFHLMVVFVVMYKVHYSLVEKFHTHAQIDRYAVSSFGKRERKRAKNVRVYVS